MRMSQVDSPGTYSISGAVVSAEESCANLREKPSPLDSHENIYLQHHHFDGKVYRDRYKQIGIL